MSDFRRMYPPNDRVTLDGGKNNKYNRAIIADNESPDCLNVVFLNGGPETRQGTTKLNTATVGTFVFDGLYTRKARSGSETMVAFAGGHMFALSTTSFITIPSAQSVFTAGVRVGTVQAENYIFIGNGGVIPYKWNGTDFTRHGVYPPTATSVAFSGASGLLTGPYSYKVTYINTALVESDVGPVSNTFTAASATIGLSAIPVAPQSFGVTARRIYRTETSGAVYKRVTTISDNTTTTYSDNTPDASLGVNAPTDNGVPPKYQFAIFHQDRLFVNDPENPNLYWYSEIGDPYTFGSTNFGTIGDNTGDLLRAFGIQDNALVCFGDKTDTIVYMPDTDPTNWTPVVVKSSYGSKSPFAIARYDNKLLFPAVQSDKFCGFAALDGNAVSPSATFLTVSTAGSFLKSDRVEPDMFEVQESYIQNMSSIVYQNRIYTALTYGSGSTTNNRIYVMDFSVENLNKQQKESWVPWTGLNAAQFTVYGGNLYYASSDTTGFVFKMEAGVYSDNGGAINSYFWTKEFSGMKSETNDDKDFRYANILVEKSGDWFMDLAYRVDSDIGTGTNTQVDLNPGGSLWGSMMFGRDAWGGGSTQVDEKIYLGTARGKRIQFKFSNQNVAGQKFKVSGLNFAYNLKGYR